MGDQHCGCSSGACSTRSTDPNYISYHTVTDDADDQKNNSTMPGHVVNATATSPNDVGETDSDVKTTPGDHESPTIEEDTNNEKSTEANKQVTNNNVGEGGGSGTIIAVVIVLIVVVAGGVGYWLINKKKTSGGASLENGPEVKKEYSEVPTN